MKYLGIKPFFKFSDESLLIYSSGVERHGVFYEYETCPTPRIRYIYIEQLNLDPFQVSWYHAFEVDFTDNSSDLDELFKFAESFVSMIISYEKAVLDLYIAH